MGFLAIPNISVGNVGKELSEATSSLQDAGGRLLDVHSDMAHNRSVLTIAADNAMLIDSTAALAVACRAIDLTKHVGVHPRVGALDVCPFVPHGSSLEDAVELAHAAGRAIADAVQAPVFFYGAAASRPEAVELPDIRRGGLEGLARRMAEGLEPDEGPPGIDPTYGAVLVGARGPLIAFNVWLETTLPIARDIASRVRETHKIRALGLEIAPGRCQVSMNLIAPQEIGIDDAYERVEREAARTAARVTSTEIVGLVPERFLPRPDARAARLLLEPGRSLESALGD
jgi:glutamate formiminotransferase